MTPRTTSDPSPWRRTRLRAIALRAPSRGLDNAALAALADARGRRLLELGGQALPWEQVGDEVDRATDPFCVAMEARGARDPFMGGRHRFFLDEGEDPLELEIGAAREAIEAAGLGVADIDLIVYASFPSARFGISAVAFVARALGHGGATQTVEAACAGSLAGIEAAALQIELGRARNVLVLAGTPYSAHVPWGDPLAWTVGDLFSAMILSADGPGARLGGLVSRTTADTCDAVSWVAGAETCRSPQRLQTSPGGVAQLRVASRRHLRPMVHGALAEAGLGPGELDALAANAPLAWYLLFASLELGVDRAALVNVHPRFNNCGAALLPASLYALAAARPPAEGAVVGAYAIGSVSAVGAAVFRWGEVALGPPPPGGILEPEVEEHEIAVARRQGQRGGSAPGP